MPITGSNSYLHDPRDGFERVWQPMRPWLTCPHCQRRGAVQRRIGVKPFVTHHCPGPFVLDHVEKTSNPARAGFNLTIYPAGPLVGFGGDCEPREEVITMCATCAVTAAAKAKDWDEVIRISQAEKAEEKAEIKEKAEVKDDLKVEKTTSKGPK